MWQVDFAVGRSCTARLAPVVGSLGIKSENTLTVTYNLHIWYLFNIYGLHLANDYFK